MTKIDPNLYIDALRSVALAGTCKKTFRGALILSPELEVISSGCIRDCPSGEYPDCLHKKDFNCPSLHAEQVAIKYATRDIPKNSLMLHLKFDKSGAALPSGELYCTTCIPIMLKNNIRYLVLFHESGWVFYDLTNLSETGLAPR